MTFEEIETAILSLGREDQKRLIMDVVPQIWRTACADASCLSKMRELVDEETVKGYLEQHMNGI
jgi:hypothetical protein